MPGKHTDTQPERPIDRWPTFPVPPTGTFGGERILIGAGYLTTAAIYIASLASTPSLRQPVTWTGLTILFGFFALSIYMYARHFELLWARLAALLFQIALVVAIVLVGDGLGSLPILYFIIIPMAYLSLGFAQASAMALLCLSTLFVSYLIVGDVGEALSTLLPYGGGFAFFAAVSMALIQQQKDRQRAEQLLTELEDAHEQLQAYAAQVEALAVAEERNRLARDIHDSLGHYLTAMTMQLQAAGKLVATQPERAAESIAKAEEMARESLSEVRHSVATLRASPVDTAALGDAIDDLIQNLRDDGIATTFTVKGKTLSLPIQAKTALYRAAQEGLTNVRKHANASAVEVRLTYEPEQVKLTVADNGTGQRDKGNAGFGLLGLQERVSLLGGTLVSGDDPDGGFRLQISVPRKTQIDE
jgi:signal transduction histidine kinase